VVIKSLSHTILIRSWPSNRFPLRQDMGWIRWLDTYGVIKGEDTYTDGRLSGL